MTNSRSFCDLEDTEPILYYRPTEKRPFNSISDLTIEPLVVFKSPLFGYYVHPTTAIQVSWKDVRVIKIEVAVIDPLTSSKVAVIVRSVLSTSSPTNNIGTPLMAFKTQLSELFATAAFPPVDSKEYKIRVVLLPKVATKSATFPGL